MNYVHAIKKTAISFAVFIALWQFLFSVSTFSSELFPSPLQVWNATLEMVSDGALFLDILASMYRFLWGYLTAVVSGVLLGGIFGWFKKAFAYINPVVQILRPISPIAWIPFIVLLVGIGDIPAIIIIFIAAFFPTFLSTCSAVRNVDHTYLMVSSNFGIKQPCLLTKIIFPAVFPQIANGLHLALGSAWIFLVAGEMVGAQTGLGYLIIDSRNNIRADKLLAAILVIGLIGFLLDTLISQAEQQVALRWGYEGRGKQ